MQVYYAYQISGNPVEDQMQEIAYEDLHEDPERLRFAERLVYTALRREPELDTIIQGHVSNWEMDRIAMLDLIIIRLGMIEFLDFPEIPPKVTINEWVEIGKKYSTEQSGRFINGMLDSILASLQAGNRILKTGRGLVNK